MGESEQEIYDQIERQLGRPATTVLAIDDAATTLMARHRIIRFRNRVMVKAPKPNEQFMPMDKATFERIASPSVIGMPRRRLNDTFDYVRSAAKDLTTNDRYILFGAGTSRQTVWDMETLELRTDIAPDDCVWRLPHALPLIAKPVEFIMDLVDNDMGLYSDTIQSLAPLLMAIKPDGVIWWTGDGTDGKLAIVEALNRIFPDQLANLSLKQLIGGRSNTPLLNSALGNIAEDGGLVTTTEIYKSIGTHEDFSMHRWHGQGGVTIRGNVHHIFLTSNPPRFYVKGLSIDRRTQVVSFGHHSKNHGRKLPDNQLGQLIGEMCRYAAIIKRQGYRYEWSKSK